MRQARIITVFVVLLIVASCEKSSLNDPVLAKVGNSTINQSHLDAMIGRLAPEVRERKEDELNNTILQGLVRTRVLAITAEQQLNEDEKKNLNAKVQAYKDEFLAQTYIKKNIKPKPVTPEMVAEYYKSHINDYTKQGKISFDIISTTNLTIKDEILEELIAALTKARNISDWKGYVKKLNKNSYPVEYKSAQMHPSSIKEEMRAQAIRLNAGEVSDVVYGKYMYIFKIINKQPDIVQPLHEVSVTIRKKLAPIQLRKELTKSIDKVMMNIKVEYIN